MRKVLRPISGSLMAMAIAACSSASSPNTSGGGSGFTAKVNGKDWAAEPVGVTARAGGVPGGVVVVGSQALDGVNMGLTISLNDITGPGTYALGVGQDVYGGYASVGEGTGGGKANVWATPLSGVAGSITISTLGEGRMVATFAYETEPDKNNTAGGTRSVTEGRIDLPLTGVLPPVPDNQGSKLSAVLNGKPYNAYAVSTFLMDITGGPGLRIDTHSSENAVSINLSAVTEPGTFTYSNQAPVRTLSAGINNDATNCCWGASAVSEVMSVIITSLTPARVKGTFTGTLQPQPGKPATMPIEITDGAFDVGTAP
jgi:hypothetical protein